MLCIQTDSIKELARFPKPHFAYNSSKYSAVGVVCPVGLYSGGIDTCGLLVVVAHTLRDYRKRHILRLGYKNPIFPLLVRGNYVVLRCDAPQVLFGFKGRFPASVQLELVRLVLRA